MSREVFVLKEERVRVRRNIQQRLERDKSVFREFKCEVYAYMKK